MPFAVPTAFDRNHTADRLAIPAQFTAGEGPNFHAAALRRRLGVSITKFEDWVRVGRVPQPVKVDGCTRFNADQLREDWKPILQGETACFKYRRDTATTDSHRLSRSLNLN